MVEAGAEAEIETVAGAEVATCVWAGAMGEGEGETVAAVKTGGGVAVETATATIAGLGAEVEAGAEAKFEARAEAETEVGAGTGAKAEAEVTTGTNISTGTGVVVARPSRAMLIVSASPLVPACAPTPSSAQPARRARVEKRGIAVSFLYRLPAAHPDNNPSRADWERGGSNFRNMGEDHVRSARIPKNPIISSNLNTKNPAGTTRRDSRIIG